MPRAAATTRGCYGTKSIEDRKKRRRAYQQQQKEEDKKKKHQRSTPVNQRQIRGEEEEEVTPIMSNTQQMEITRQDRRLRRKVEVHHEEEDEEEENEEVQVRRKRTKRKAAATSFQTSYFPNRQKNNGSTTTNKNQTIKKKDLSLSATSFEWDAAIEENGMGRQKRIIDDDEDDDDKEEVSHDEHDDDNDTVSLQLEEGEHEHHDDINTDEEDDHFHAESDDENHDEEEKDEDFENESNVSSPLPTQEKQMQQKVQLARLRSSSSTFIDRSSPPVPSTAASKVQKTTAEKIDAAKTRSTTPTTTTRRRNKRRIVVTKQKLPPVPKAEDDDVFMGDGNGLSFVSSQRSPTRTAATATRKRGRPKKQVVGEENDAVMEEDGGIKVQGRNKSRKGGNATRNIEDDANVEQEEGKEAMVVKEQTRRRKKQKVDEMKIVQKGKQKSTRGRSKKIDQSTADDESDDNVPPLKQQEKSAKKIGRNDNKENKRVDETKSEKKNHPGMSKGRMRQLRSTSVFESQLECASNGVSSSKKPKQQKKSEKRKEKERKEGNDVDDENEDEQSALVNVEQKISKQKNRVNSSSATDIRSKKKKKSTTMDNDNADTIDGKTERMCKEEQDDDEYLSISSQHGEDDEKSKAKNKSLEGKKVYKERKEATATELTIECDDGEDYVDDNEEEDPNVRAIVLGLDALTNHCHACVDLYNDGKDDDMSTTTLLNVQHDGTLRKIADVFVSFRNIRSSLADDADDSSDNASFHDLLERAIGTFGLQPGRQALFASLLLLLYLSSRVLSEDEENVIGDGNIENILSMLCDCLRFFVDVRGGLFGFYGPNSHRRHCMPDYGLPESIFSTLTDPPIVTNLLKVLTLVSSLERSSSSVSIGVQMESVSLILGCLHAIDMHGFVDRISLIQDEGEDGQSLILLKQSIKQLMMDMKQMMCYPVMELGFLFVYSLRRSILQMIEHYDETGEEAKRKDLISFLEGIDDFLPCHIYDLMTSLDSNLDSACDQGDDDQSHMTLDKRDPQLCAELCRKVLLSSSVVNVSSFRCNGVYAPTVSSGDMGTRVADIPFIDIDAGEMSFFAIVPSMNEKRDGILDENDASPVKSMCSCRTLVQIRMDALKNPETKSSFGTSVFFNTEDCVVTIRLSLSDWSESNLAELLDMRAENKARLSVSESVSIGSSSTCRRKDQELRESENQTKVLKIFIRRTEFKNFLSVLAKHNVPMSNEDDMTMAGDTSPERKMIGGKSVSSATDSKCTKDTVENRKETQNATRDHVEFSTRFGLEDPSKIISLLNPNIPTKCAETEKSLAAEDHPLESSEFVMEDSAVPCHGAGASAVSIESNTSRTSNGDGRSSAVNLREELNASAEECSSYDKPFSAAISTPDVQRKQTNTVDLDQSKRVQKGHCPNNKDAVEVTPHPQVDAPQKNRVENQFIGIDNNSPRVGSELISTPLCRYPSNYGDAPTSLGAISALCFAGAKVQKSTVANREQGVLTTTLPSSVDLFSNDVKNDDLVDAIYAVDNAFRCVAHEITKLSASASNLVAKMKLAQKDQNQDLVNSLKWVGKIEKDFRDGADDWTGRRRCVDDQLKGLLVKALKK